MKYKNWLKKKRPHEYTGPFSSWSEALKNSTSYSKPEILEKTLKSTLEVQKNPNLFERDSVVLNEPQYSWPILSYLLHSINEVQNCHVLDIGGGLGSHFFQYRRFLKKLNIMWSIIEQPEYVEAGREHINLDPRLSFYSRPDEAIKRLGTPNLVLASGVFQYLEKPEQTISEIVSFHPKRILIDRTVFFIHEDHKKELMVQNIPDWIFRASYPSWIFQKSEFISKFDGYRLLHQFHSSVDPTVTIHEKKEICHLGFILEKEH